MSAAPAPMRLAAAGAAILWSATTAQAGDCGERTFPNTLAIDEPSVNDEISLPTLTYLAKNADGARELDAAFNWTKAVTENLGVSIGGGKAWLKPGGNGWGNLDTAVKYSFFCDPSHEFMAALGADVNWANTGTPGFSNPFSTYTPLLDIGKGFGDLPTSLDVLRPLAVTAEFGVAIPSEGHTTSIVVDRLGDRSLGVALNPTVINAGFAVQYSLPYLSASVGRVDAPDVVKHLILITEFSFQIPVGNLPRGAKGATGTIQPGIIYSADAWQLAVEAVIPANAASGRQVGVIGELHFFLDEMVPNSFLGRPLFRPPS